MSEVGQSEPAYKTLAAELRSHIAQGRYKGGVRLPTESELSQEYAESADGAPGLPRTGHRGSVYRVPGRGGTFATENAGQYLRQLGSIDDLMNLSTDTEMQVLESPSRRVDLEAAGRLRLDTDVVYRIVFQRFHDGVPFVVTTVSWPESVARLVIDAPEVKAGATSDHTMIGLLEPHLQYPIEECAQSITATTAEAETPSGSAARWVTPCCASTDSTPIHAGGPSNSRSATSCPSTTRTA